MSSKRSKTVEKKRLEVLDALINETQDHSSVPTTLAARFFRQADTPTTLGLFLCLKYNDFESLVRHSVNPLSYLDTQTDEFFIDNQACKLLAKYQGFPAAADTLARKAKETYLAGEAQCAFTNQVFNSWEKGQFCFPPKFTATLIRAHELIERILGELDVEEWLDHCRFGPGKAYASPGTSDYSKLNGTPSVTEEFLALSGSFLSEFPGWVNALCGHEDISTAKLVVTQGGKYAQVPKDAKTNRNIETQPSINLFAQRGLGRIIREKLVAVGVNLRSQERNQQLAKVGSIKGNLATIDLSNASDTISSAFVRSLLPTRWYFALNLTRTRAVEFEGSIVPLEKFSAMGNGFTFELESLLFYAIAHSACVEDGNSRPLVSVYGDDIIVPSKHYGSVVEALRLCGFTVNLSKSYSTGCFRESCGADWFNGVFVRPFYIKEVPTNVASLVTLANGVYRSGSRRCYNNNIDRRFISAYDYVRQRIPSSIRRNLAVGKTDDSVLYGEQICDGYRITFVPHEKRPERWYGAVSAALYRCFVRDPLVKRYRETHYIHLRDQPLIVGSKSNLTYCDRAGTSVPGVFKLVPVRQDKSWCLVSLLDEKRR